MKTVEARELGNLRMVEGGEKKYQIVIDSGLVKEWVGIGWIELRKATFEDREQYPIVTRNGHE